MQRDQANKTHLAFKSVELSNFNNAIKLELADPEYNPYEKIEKKSTEPTDVSLNKNNRISKVSFEKYELENQPHLTYTRNKRYQAYSSALKSPKSNMRHTEGQSSHF